MIGGVGGVCPHMSRAGVAAAAEGVQQHPAGNEKSSGTGGLTVSGTVIIQEVYTAIITNCCTLSRDR